MTKPLILLGCALPLLATAQWRVSRPIIAGPVPLTGPSVVAVPLDPAVYATSNPDLSDIRIRDGNGAEIPYVICPGRHAKEDERHTKQPMTLQSLERKEDQLTLLARFSGTNAHTVVSLTLDTPLEDFEQTITLLTETGEPLGEPQVIYDYSRHAPIRKTQINVPRTSAHGFKIVIGKAIDELFNRYFTVTEHETVARPGEAPDRYKRYAVDQRPFQITGLSADTVQTVRIVEPEPNIRDITVPVEDLGEGRYRLHTRHLPVVAIHARILDANFQRSVTVSTEERRTVARAALRSVTLPGRSERNDVITFPEAREAALEVAFSATDNAPLRLDPNTPFDLEIRPYVICFIAEPGVPYRLDTGNPAIKQRPVYEQQVDAYLNDGFNPIRWELTPAPLPPLPSRSFLSQSQFLKRYGFVLCALLVTALLAWACVRTLRGKGAES